jgi:hypothetical protein
MEGHVDHIHVLVHVNAVDIFGTRISIRVCAVATVIQGLVEAEYVGEHPSTQIQALGYVGVLGILLKE